MARGTTLIWMRWATTLAVVLILIAMLVYPGGTGRDPTARGYSFFRNSLSDLGSTVAHSGESNHLGAGLFFASLGLLTIAIGRCLVALIRLYSRAPVPRYLVRAAGIGGMFGCLALAGVAFTPHDKSPELHGQFTLVAYLAFVIAAIFSGLAAARDGRFSRGAVTAWLVLAGVLIVHVSIMRLGPLVTTDSSLMLHVTSQKIVALAVVCILVYQGREVSRIESSADGGKPA